MSNDNGKFILKRNKHTNIIKNIFKYSNNEQFTLQQINIKKIIKSVSILILLFLVIYVLVQYK